MTVTTVHGVDEETPLLQTQQKKRSPIDWSQFMIVLFLQLAEPLTSQVIYPFSPQVSVQELQSLNWRPHNLSAPNR